MCFFFNCKCVRVVGHRTFGHVTVDDPTALHVQMSILFLLVF